MQQKDYILREIEKISQLLKYFLGKVAGEKAHTTSSFEKLCFEFDENTSIQIDEILRCKKNDFEVLLPEEKGFNQPNNFLLADFLFSIMLSDKKKEQAFKQKAIELYEFVIKKSRIYDMEREKRLIEMKKHISFKY